MPVRDSHLEIAVGPTRSPLLGYGHEILGCHQSQTSRADCLRNREPQPFSRQRRRPVSASYASWIRVPIRSQPRARNSTSSIGGGSRRKLAGAADLGREILGGAAGRREYGAAAGGSLGSVAPDRPGCRQCCHSRDLVFSYWTGESDVWHLAAGRFGIRHCMCLCYYGALTCRSSGRRAPAPDQNPSSVRGWAVAPDHLPAHLR
jgi:hypothetical protein